VAVNSPRRIASSSLARGAIPYESANLGGTHLRRVRTISETR